MASQHVEITGTASRLARDFRNFVDGLRIAQQSGGRVDGIVEQVASGGDWAALGTELGIDAADAETTYNLLQSALVHLNDAAITALLDRLG
ncbi:MAG: hypothetical protein GY832_03770 [Chloroflexi bacterium]|nr:hypothetical protein [Chloroflexota bacterium]